MEQGIVYSVCSGYNMYYTEFEERSVLERHYFLVRHIHSNEEYFARIVNHCSEADLPFWREIIRNPVSRDCFIWPVDMIRKSSDEYALVFAFKSCLKLANIESVFKKSVSGDIDIKLSDEYLDLIDLFLSVWCSFYADKYVFHEFSSMNLFISDQHTLIVDFSLSIDTCELGTSKNPGSNMILENYNLEYIDPYYFQKEDLGVLDINSDYYSISTILFKMLIGKLPFDGPLMERLYYQEGKKEWFKEYAVHSSYFIMGDEEDRAGENKLGVVEHDRRFLDRWEGLSADLCCMFTESFQHDNVTRRSGKVKYYPPQEWLKAFREWRIALKG